MLSPKSRHLHVGVDIGSRCHAVAIGLSDGRLLEEFEIPHSAAIWPQPKVATPRRSGFDLRRQDLQPDEQVNHRDGQRDSHEEFP